MAKAVRPAVTAKPAKTVTVVVPPSEPLFRATELDGSLAARKPVKTPASVRPPRPPAKLPIPVSTYFF
jgi:hypothetical protein